MLNGNWKFRRTILTLPAIVASTWLGGHLLRSDVENVHETSATLVQTDWMGIYTSSAVGGLMAGVDTGLVCAAVYWVLWRVNSTLDYSS